MESPDVETGGPPVRLVDARITVALDAAGAPIQGVIGAEGVLASTRPFIELRFDRYLDPRTVARRAICLRSDLAPVQKPEDCSSAVFLNVAYDPVGRRFIAALDETQNPELSPDTTYALTIFPSEAGGPGVRAFDRAPSDDRIELQFRTQLTPTPEDRRAEFARVSGAECRALDLVLAKCAACHTTPEGSPAGLVIDGRASLLATGLGVAHGAALGADADTGADTPARLGAAMPVIDLGAAGNSYLLYKVLARTPVEPATLAPGETDRLRQGLITGMPMPPPGNPPLSVGSSRVDLQACKLEYSIVSPK